MIAFPAMPSVDLRVSVTDRCQFRCLYCMPAEGVTMRACSDILRFEEIAAFVRRLQHAFQVRKVRLTGGEPLVRPDLPKLVRLLAELGVPDLALTTNGQALESLAPALKDAGLHRVNASLDSLDPLVFAQLTRGGDLARTLAGIAAAVQVGLRPVKLNMVVMRGINDGEIGAMLAHALDTGCELRFLELMPIGTAARSFERWFVAAETMRETLAADYRLTPLPVDASTTSRDYRVEDRQGRSGRVGFIAPCSASFCDGCRRLRLTSDGHLIGCLASGRGVSIRDVLDRDPRQAARVLRGRVAAELGTKAGTNAFETQRAMVSVGG